MWNLSSNRLSYEEYWILASKGNPNSAIISHANMVNKQCNTNLCTLYKKAKPFKDCVEFNGYKITPKNIDKISINKAYLGYLREHFGLPSRRHTIVSCDDPLTEIQKQVIIGTLLGDGYIPKRENSLRMCHGDKQYNYLEHKIKLLGHLVKTPIKTSHYVDKRTNRAGVNVYARTIPHQFIKDMKESFYLKSGKTIPDNVIQMLNPLGLAIWYCDDGSVMGKKARLCTNCFTKDELKRLTVRLGLVFGFKKLWINNQNIIVFSRWDTTHLKSIIGDNMPPCMLYKVRKG